MKQTQTTIIPIVLITTIDMPNLMLMHTAMGMPKYMNPFDCLQITPKMVVCTATKSPPTYKFAVTNVKPTFVQDVIGVMNIKPIMRLEYVIDVMRFIVEIVMKWINVMIVVRLFVHPAAPC